MKVGSRDAGERRVALAPLGAQGWRADAWAEEQPGIAIDHAAPRGCLPQDVEQSVREGKLLSAAVFAFERRQAACDVRVE